MPYVPSDGAPDLLRNVGALARAFRASERTVVLTVQHPGGPPGRTDRRPPRVVVGDDFTELMPELDQRPTDLVVHKSQWGAFTGTSLHARLKELRVTQIVLCGVSTSMGVESTARIGHELGYNVLVAADATADPSSERDHHSKTEIFPAIAQVATTGTILALLWEQRRPRSS